jgi:exodeoxyribonuclease-3
LTVITVYVVNGRRMDNPAYKLKLKWLTALHDWIAATFDPDDQLLLAGDFNIARDERDAHEPAGGKT